MHDEHDFNFHDDVTFDTTPLDEPPRFLILAEARAQLPAEPAGRPGGTGRW